MNCIECPTYSYWTVKFYYFYILHIGNSTDPAHCGECPRLVRNVCMTRSTDSHIWKTNPSLCSYKSYYLRISTIFQNKWCYLFLSFTFQINNVLAMQGTEMEALYKPCAKCHVSHYRWEWIVHSLLYISCQFQSQVQHST
jgi:hypothetical protein